MPKQTKTQSQDNAISGAGLSSTDTPVAGIPDDRTDRIRSRAHAIWESEGRPDNRNDDHWLQAEREISQEGDGLEANDVTDMGVLREAAREHTDAFIVKSDLEDAEQRETTPGVREQP